MFRKSQLNFIKSFILILVLFIGLVYSFSGGDGSLATPWIITNCTELQEMNTCVTCNYTIDRNIDCSATSGWNLGEGFLPVGNSTDEFIGTLYGQNKVISNLFINRSSMDYVGLFGIAYVSAGVHGNFYNIGLENADVSGNDAVGSLVGFGRYIIINNSYSSGNLNGNGNFIGGLVGAGRDAIIDNSYSTNNVNGINNVGGLIGFGATAIINNSYSTGNVNGSDYVGGLVGNGVAATIDNSYSTSNANGINDVGGLVGYGASATIDNSYSTGNVNGTNDVGGLVGYGYWTTIDNSYSINNINGTTNVGGLVGSGEYVTIDNSYFTGNVNGSSQVGGLVGYGESANIDNCYWNNHSLNPNVSVGDGVPTLENCTAVDDDIDWFYNCSNEPMVSWDLINNWYCSGTSFPQLAWTVSTPDSSSSLSNIFPFQNLASIFLLLSVSLGYLIFS